MNKLDETIQRHGKTYHYDPDHDVYTCRYTSRDLGHFDQYSWLYTIALLGATVWALS